MEKLIKPAEFAQSQNISRQAVYAKIKRGMLGTKNVDGKLYIVVNDDETGSSQPSPSSAPGPKGETQQNAKPLPKNELPRENKPQNTPSSSLIDYKLLLKSKDETISVLKGTVKDLKKSNKQMSTTLRGEIDLLKQAFHEMRSLYITQIEHIKAEDTKSRYEKSIDEYESESTIEVSVAKASTETFPEHEVEAESESDPFDTAKWISPKKFLKRHAIYDDLQKLNFKNRIRDAYALRDERLRVIDGKIRLNIDANFDDLLGY